MAEFTFEEIVQYEGGRCARIVGRVGNWPEDVKMKCEVELYFSRERGVPVTSTLNYKSESRTQTVTARSVFPVQLATAGGH